MKRMFRNLIFGVMLIAGAGTARASQDARQPVAENDYANGVTWLCGPGCADACAADLSTTVISANGKMMSEEFAADANARRRLLTPRC
jgi:hypothetical protein